LNQHLERLKQIAATTTRNEQTPTSINDYFSVHQDMAGTGSAVLRFLMQAEDDFVAIWNHGFKVGDEWFIETCPSTLRPDAYQTDTCPVCKAVYELYKTDPAEAKKRQRKVTYHSNILVVKDPKRPHNEGKVFSYKFGIKVFEHLERALDSGLDPTGANFNLRVYKQNGYPTYDRCTFQDPSELTDESVLQRCRSFAPLMKFKEWHELEAKYNRICGKQATEDDKDKDFIKQAVARQQQKAKPVNDDDDFFEKLANETPAPVQDQSDFLAQLAATNA
jgi:gp32 DNA binding protein like